MKKIGLVGGLTWFSTIEYYRNINELVSQHEKIAEELTVGEFKDETRSEFNAISMRMVSSE